MVELIFIHALAAAYIVKVLRYDESAANHGYILHNNKFVVNLETGHHHEVAFFDYVRRFIFNPYNIEDTVWHVNNQKMQLWSCPKCLSFWVSALLIILLLLNNFRAEPANILVIHLSIAFLSALFNLLYDRVENVFMQEEKES